MKGTNFLGVMLDESLNWKSEIYVHLDRINFTDVSTMKRSKPDLKILQIQITKIIKYV